MVFAVCICLSSCYTVSDISIGVLEPAEISLPSGIRNISIYAGPKVNKAGRMQLDSLDNLRLDEDVDYSKFYMEFLIGLADILDESPRIDSIVTGENVLEQNDPENIPWNDIIRICKKDNTDAMIILNGFKLKDTLKIDLFPVLGCYVEYSIFNNAEWLIYYPKEFKLIEKYNYTDVLIWHAVDNYCQDALKDLPDNITIISESFYRAGKKYGKRIAPVWSDNVSRNYYATGNRLFRLAKQSIDNNQWSEAAEIWRDMTNQSDKILASKACYNMAVACEIEDELELAKIWLMKSYKLLKSPRTENYMNTIKERLEHKDKLDLQLHNN